LREALATSSLPPACSWLPPPVARQANFQLPTTSTEVCLQPRRIGVRAP
jgi:hypothetical protein